MDGGDLGNHRFFRWLLVTDWGPMRLNAPAFTTILGRWFFWNIFFPSMLIKSKFSRKIVIIFNQMWPFFIYLSHMTLTIIWIYFPPRMPVEKRRFRSWLATKNVIMLVVTGTRWGVNPRQYSGSRRVQNNRCPECCWFKTLINKKNCPYMSYGKAT